MTTETNAPDAAMLPCPHCNGSAQVDWCDGFPYVRCIDCGCGTMMHMSQDERQPIAAWNRRAGQAHERSADAGLLAAASAVLADWDKRMRGDQERYVPPRADNELDGYWSPNAAMVSSEQIAALRAAITAAKGHDHAE